MIGLIEPFIWLMPGLIGNSAPVFAAKFNFFGLKSPIDGGRVAGDGNRLLGDGKTWQGVIASTLAGAAVGYILEGFGKGSVLLGAVMGFAAILGDMIGSFFKRRMGYKRGANAGVFERIDFIIPAMMVSFPYYPWTIWQVVWVLVLVPFIHSTANKVGYWLKLKDVPW